MMTANDGEDEEGRAPFTTAGLTGERAVFSSKDRPVLDRSFNPLNQTAKIRLSGFNPCLQVWSSDSEFRVKKY
jgi:hypothetical protein